VFEVSISVKSFEIVGFGVLEHGFSDKEVSSDILRIMTRSWT
jgi:hypothetical protein